MGHVRAHGFDVARFIEVYRLAESFRGKNLADEIAGLEVMAFDYPALPTKSGDQAEKTSKYEGYDLITLQKEIERGYVIPEPQTAQEVICCYARRIAQEVKLPFQFTALAPKMREFFELISNSERTGRPISKVFFSGIGNIVRISSFQGRPVFSFRYSPINIAAG
jgi:hypothetical protein